MTPLKFKIRFYHNIFGNKMYEGDLTYVDKDGKGQVQRGINVPCGVIPSSAGIIRYPSYKKAETWLNSGDGMAYLKSKLYVRS